MFFLAVSTEFGILYYLRISSFSSNVRMCLCVRVCGLAWNQPTPHTRFLKWRRVLCSFLIFGDTVRLLSLINEWKVEFYCCSSVEFFSTTTTTNSSYVAVLIFCSFANCVDAARGWWAPTLVSLFFFQFSPCAHHICVFLVYVCLFYLFSLSTLFVGVIVMRCHWIKENWVKNVLFLFGARNDTEKSVIFVIGRTLAKCKGFAIFTSGCNKQWLWRWYNAIICVILWGRSKK